MLEECYQKIIHNFQIGHAIILGNSFHPLMSFHQVKIFWNIDDLSDELKNKHQFFKINWYCYLLIIIYKRAESLTDNVSNLCLKNLFRPPSVTSAINTMAAAATGPQLTDDEKNKILEDEQKELAKMKVSLSVIIKCPSWPISKGLMFSFNFWSDILFPVSTR